MSLFNIKDLGLTFESKMNDKKVIHNGVLGRYSDFEVIEGSKVEGLDKTVTGLYSYLKSKTQHEVLLHTFGVEVNVRDNHGVQGKAFVGYDESVDFKLRLCYCSDTFLAMELIALIQAFQGVNSLPEKEIGYNKTDVIENSELKLVTDVTEEGDEDAFSLENSVTKESIKFKTHNFRDFGWGKVGRTQVRTMMRERVEKVCSRLSYEDTIPKHKVEEFRNNVKNSIKVNEGMLTKGMSFNKGEPVYTLFYDILSDLSALEPYFVVNQRKSRMTLETVSGTVLLNVYDKNSGNVKVEKVGNVVISKTVPVYKGLKKMLDVLGSSVSFVKIKDEETGVDARGNDDESGIEKVKEVLDMGQVPVVGQTNKATDWEVAPECEVTNKKVQTVSEFYDIYLESSGKWSSTSDKYVNVKKIIEGIIVEHNIDGVSLKGIDDTDLVIDWVIDKQTYTMALTSKATKVSELEVTYDMVIAYDTDYPEILEALIKNKLKDFLDW